MNKLILTLLFVAAGTSTFAQKKKQPSKAQAAAAAGKEKSLALGSDIPFAGAQLMSAADGKQTSLEQEKTDKGLIVMFSCNTCPYVIKAKPRTREAMTQAKNMHIGMVILNSNEAQRQDEDGPIRMREFAASNKYTVPYLMDQQSQIADAFGATHTPEVFLFDGNGKLVYKGALEDNPAEPAKSKVGYLLEALHALDAGKPIKVAETKSIGCSIKRMQM